MRDIIDVLNWKDNENVKDKKKCYYNYYWKWY